MCPDEIDGNGKAADSGVESLQNWLEGDDTGLISWLSGGKQISFGSEEELRSKVSLYEEELASLRDTNQQQADDEITELRSSIERLNKEREELVTKLDVMETMPDGGTDIATREASLEEREAELRQREESLFSQGGGEALKKRFVAEVQEKESEYLQKETELRSEIQNLERELEKLRIEAKLRDEELELAKMDKTDREGELENMINDLRSKQGNSIMVEQESERLRIQIREKDDELEKIRELLKFKNEEFNRREEDLLYREKLMTEELRRFEEAKKEATGLDELENMKRLEVLRAEIHAKQEEINAKEKFLNIKNEELRLREQGIIEDEIETRSEERAMELQQAKVKIGNPRLNDLLLGGIPFGSNALVHGPPFVGKEVLVNQFMAEGLAKGIPIIWVITDKTAADIRGEMHYVISGYEEYEKLGFVKYIDSYSRSMGDMSEDEFTHYVDDPADHKGIADAVDIVAAEFKEDHDYYRLAFRSISTLIAYSDPNSAFRFLNPFAGKRKKDRAVSMYVVEKGMHGEQEIQMLGMIMDGMLDFKVDQLRTFLSVKGVCDVQSRGSIRYTFTNRGLNIGSFSLDHIK